MNRDGGPGSAGQDALIAAARTLPAHELTITLTGGSSAREYAFRGALLTDYLAAEGWLALDDEGVVDRHVMVTAQDGMRVAIALAEVAPLLTSKQILLAYEQNGRPPSSGLRLVVPDDGLAGRSLHGVVSVALADPPAPAAASPADGAVHLSGLLDRPGPRTLDALRGAGDAAAGDYAGASLYGLLHAAGIRLEPAAHEDFLNKVVVATGADGQVAVFAGGELDPRFMDAGVVVAVSRAGAPIGAPDGPVRLVAPRDIARARWLKGLRSLALLPG